MAVPRMELAGDGEPDATHHLDGGDDRRERGAPRSARRLADGETRGDRDRAGVDDRVLARIVEIEPMREGRVRQHGVGGRDPNRAADDGALRFSAEPLGRRARGAAKVIAGRRQTASQGIERQETGFLDDGRRQARRLERHDEACETPGSGERHGVPPRTSLSTSRIAAWIRPLLATREGESRFRAPPVRSVIWPPASSTSRLPAATSHGPSRSSQ